MSTTMLPPTYYVVKPRGQGALSFSASTCVLTVGAPGWARAR